MGVSVTFQNFASRRKQWAIKDSDSVTVLFDDWLEPRGEEGDSVTCELSPGSGRYTEAWYKHADQPIWTHKQYLEEGNVVDMV